MPDTAHHCRLCGTFHDELIGCPDLVPGYWDTQDGKLDAKDQARWDAHTAAAVDKILGA